MVAHQLFEIVALFLVASVMNSIGVQEKNVPRFDQRVCNIRVVRRPLPKVHREIALSVWMVFGNLQSKRQEAHHPAFINLDELPRLCREQKRRWMAEIDEPEMTGRTHLAVQQSRDLTRTLLHASPQCIPSRDRLRQPEIELFK